MYTESELQAIKNQQKRRWYVLGGVCLVLLAALVYSLVIRSQKMTVGLTLVMGVLLIFFYDLTIKPIRCYGAFVDQALHGRRRELDCTFSSADADVSVVDGVKYYALHLVQKDDDGDPFERMLYWDAERPLPQLHEGARLHILYHDRMVADLTVV